MVIANRGALDLKKTKTSYFLRKKKKFLRRSNEGGGEIFAQHYKGFFVANPSIL